MLRLRDRQLKLWDAILAQPELLRLPERLQTIDRWLDDDRFMQPFLDRNKHKRGRPTVPMECYVRLMVIKHERRLGYETLVQEVADSITLRRFVRLDLGDPVPHPTTLSRLTRKFGEGTTAEIHAALLKKLEEEGFVKGLKQRTDTTVMKADVEHPTDSGLLADGVRAVTRTVEKLKKLGSQFAEGFQDRTRSMKKNLMEIGRVLKKRLAAAEVPEPSEDGTDQPQPLDAKAQIRQKVNDLTANTYKLASATVKEALEITKRAKRQAARAPQAVKARVASLCLVMTAWITLTQRALQQTQLRLKGQTTIPNRMVSLYDPDARPIRKGKLSAPTEFGYLLELTQVENRFISDYRVHVGNPGDSTLAIPLVERHIKQFGRPPEEMATDRGYYSAANEKALEAMGVKRVSMPKTGKLSKAREEHQRQAWFRRLQAWRAGSEGSISHYKRQYGGDRSRLRGREGASIWAGWGAISHNLHKVHQVMRERAARTAQLLKARAARAAQT